MFPPERLRLILSNSILKENAVREVRRLWRFVKRHPKATLITSILVYFLAPVANDWIVALPWSIQRGIGWIFFFAVVGVCAARLLWVRPSDDRPLDLVDESGRESWLRWIVPACCVALGFPLLQHPENHSKSDWDVFLGKFEAMRQTIVYWGQFPWWDPWTRGGFPLAADPQIGAAGIATPLVCALGTTTGLGVATIVCFVLAAEGSRRLASLWFHDPLAATTASLIYTLNGAILVTAASAYHASMWYFSYPWVLYHLFRLERRLADGLWLGFWLAFNVLNGIHYFSVYSMVVGGVVALRVLRARTWPARWRFLAHAVVAVGMFVSLTGWRLATSGAVYRDFPRRSRPYFTSITLPEIPASLLGRAPASIVDAMTAQEFWERANYFGPVVVILVLVSLCRGWRWWHTLTFLCGWLALGGRKWYELSFWLQFFPFFGSMHVVSRWRFMAFLGLALAAGEAIGWLRASPSRMLRQLALLLFALIAFDYVSYGYEILPLAFGVSPSEDQFPGPPVTRGIIQVADSAGYPALVRGYGVIHGLQPLLGYDREAVTARLWRGHPSYVGEYWTDEGPVEPLYWSPNHIILQVRPFQRVYVNQNPGSWWIVNGQPPDLSLRCAETRKMFQPSADSHGRLDLRIQPRGLEQAPWIHLGGAVLLATGVVVARRLPPINPPRAAVPSESTSADG